MMKKKMFVGIAIALIVAMILPATFLVRLVRWLCAAGILVTVFRHPADKNISIVRRIVRTVLRVVSTLKRAVAFVIADARRVLKNETTLRAALVARLNQNPTYAGMICVMLSVPIYFVVGLAECIDSVNARSYNTSTPTPAEEPAVADE